MEGNIHYNTFHYSSEALGFESKIGLVKNVSGPFIAGLANLDGYYGGYHCETSGDCIRIDFYVERNDYEETGSVSSYEDVPSDAWYSEDIQDLTKRQIINGISESSFAPYTPVTRAQFIKMMAVNAGIAPDTSLCRFTDVPRTHWAAPFIEWGAENGIINGTGNGEFSPDEPVTREQIASIISRYISSYGISICKTVPPAIFSDQDSIAPYACNAVAELSEYGILQGREDHSFDPSAVTTRAEAVSLMARLIRKCI